MGYYKLTKRQTILDYLKNFQVIALKKNNKIAS